MWPLTLLYVTLPLSSRDTAVAPHTAVRDLAIELQGHSCGGVGPCGAAVCAAGVIVFVLQKNRAGWFDRGMGG